MFYRKIHATLLMPYQAGKANETLNAMATILIFNSKQVHNCSPMCNTEAFLMCGGQFVVMLKNLITLHFMWNNFRLTFMLRFNIIVILILHFPFCQKDRRNSSCSIAYRLGEKNENQAILPHKENNITIIWKHKANYNRLTLFLIYHINM